MCMKLDGGKFEHLGILDLTWGYSGPEVTFHLIDLISIGIWIPNMTVLGALFGQWESERGEIFLYSLQALSLNCFAIFSFLFNSVGEEDFGSGEGAIAFGFREMQLQSSHFYRRCSTTIVGLKPTGWGNGTMAFWSFWMNCEWINRLEAVASLAPTPGTQ